MSHFTLPLTASEIHDLVEVIDYRLGELEDELVHTDNHAFRDALRDASDRLAALRARVHHLVADLPVGRPPSALARRIHSPG